MRRRTPREKKELEYTKDHVNSAEYPHAFRKAWPRKKARLHRAYRRQVHSLLTSLTTRQEEDFPDKMNPGTVRRQQVQKWPVTPYGVVIKNRPITRIDRMGHNFFRYNYDTSRDREGFAAFLKSQVGGHTDKSRRLAMNLRDLLDIRLRPSHINMHSWWDKRHVWLLAFFRDEPEWEHRVRKWISTFEQTNEGL